MDESIDMDSRAVLSRIELIFENCEFCIIPKDQIRLLHLEQFNQSINYSEWNGLHKFNKCSLEILQINKEYLLNNHAFIANEEHINDKETLLDRISNYNDIVSINIYWVIYDVEYKKQYYLPWDDKDEYKNKYQKVDIEEEIVTISVTTNEENKTCNNKDLRLKEICEKVLEINEEAEEYVAIFVDGRGNPIPKDMLYFIFKDGNGQEELFELELEDLKLCKENDLLEENSYQGFHRRKIYKFKIDKVEKVLNDLLGV